MVTRVRIPLGTFTLPIISAPYKQKYSRSLESTIDILSVNPELNLSLLLAPEHGIRGDSYAGENVTNTKDTQYHLPVYTSTLQKMEVLAR